MASDPASIKEVNITVKALEDKLTLKIEGIKDNVRALIEGIERQLKIMIGVFVACVTIGATGLGALYQKVSEISASTRSVAGNLDRQGNKFSNLVDDGAQFHDAVLADLEIIKSAVRLGPPSPSPSNAPLVTRAAEPSAYAFEGWLGAPLLSADFVAKALASANYSPNNTWLYSKNFDMIATLRKFQPIPDKSELDEKAFNGWIGTPISDYKQTAVIIAKEQPSPRSTWTFSRDASLARVLVGEVLKN